MNFYQKYLRWPAKTGCDNIQMVFMNHTDVKQSDTVRSILDIYESAPIILDSVPKTDDAALIPRLSENTIHN